MSGNSKAGTSSRSFRMIAVAAIAVAMMLAVPLFTAFDSEAKFSDREAGYSMAMDNPTDDDLTKFDVNKSSKIVNASSYFLKLFNKDPYGSPAVTAGSFKYTESEGIKVESNDSRYFVSGVVDARDVTITYTATSEDDLIDDYVTYFDEKYKAAGAAVVSVFGSKVHVGDTLTITGNVKYEVADETKMSYADVNDTTVVAKDGTDTAYYVTDMDVTITLKHGDDSKSIKFSSNYKFEFDREYTYDYNGVAYSDLTNTSPCTIKYGIDKYSFESGSSNYVVEGKDYSVQLYVLPGSDVPGTAKLLTDSYAETAVSNIQTEANLLPESTANVTVKKTYSDADSAFADVALDVVGNDILKIILIVVGVVLGLILLIVIVVIVIIVLRKKKKQQ